MSDPVENIEIEDVLSSIRRLVSEENRPEQRSEEPAAKVEPVDRLVLTPSFRVAEPQPEPVDESSDAGDYGADDSEQAQDQNSDFDNSEGQISDPDAPWKDPQATLYKAAQVIAEETAGAAPETDDVAEDKVAAEWQNDADTTEAGSDHTAAYDNDNDIQSDWDTADDLIEADADGEVVDEPSDHTDQHDQDTGGSDEGGSHEAEADDLTLSARIEVLEAAVADTDERWEPDGPDQDEYSGTRVETMQWHDADAGDDDNSAAEQSNDGEGDRDWVSPNNSETEAQQAADDDDDVLDFLVADEAIMDEESLRELVADIVREELQGALGERITRNVRKLVRREIHRALAAQDLE